MQKLFSQTDLKNAIQLAETEQAVKVKRLKEQLCLTRDSFEPVNIITGTLNDLAKSPYLVDNIAGTAMGLATGYLSKALIVGTSGSKIRRLIGTIIQFGITNVVAQNSESMKSFARSLFQNISRKRVTNADNS